LLVGREERPEGILFFEAQPLALFLLEARHVKSFARAAVGAFCVSENPRAQGLPGGKEDVLVRVRRGQ